ncbi:uncharacterized protein C6orf136 homolog [Halichondria panicea]|uniref:uncharacterized protein C6orf136 homolog n=1 Tax=Halichondria panicea TaxID=6063 RepID=UPI00312B6161
MSVQYMREALLTRDKHAALVKQALRCLPPAQALTITRPRPSTPGPALTAMSRRPPSSDTHLPLLLDSYQTWWYLDESLEAPPARETPPSPQDGPSPAQLAYVLLKLREEIPAFFAGHHSYDLYDPHMRYENQLWRYPWKGCGLLSYRLFLQGFRLALGGVASGLCTDLLRITKDAEEGKIEARWRVKGQYHCSRRQRVLLDGMSTFCINSDGLIYLHRLSRLEPPRKYPLTHTLMTWLALRRKLPQPAEL